MALQITSAGVDDRAARPALGLPLEEWPEEILAALPAASHVTSCASCGCPGEWSRSREIKAEIASREYHMLRNLQRLDAPHRGAVCRGRGSPDADGEPLDAC